MKNTHVSPSVPVTQNDTKLGVVSAPSDNLTVSTKPRFTLVIKTNGYTGELMFYTLAGLEQWLANARQTGELEAGDKVEVYDDSGCRL